jgi:hypothetical protein
MTTPLGPDGGESSATVVVLVHSHPGTGAPVGVWFQRDDADGSPTRSAYLVPEVEGVGREAMARRGPGRSWVEFAGYLADSSPYEAWWSDMTVDEATDPGAFLCALAAEWAERRWHTTSELTPGSPAMERYRFAADRAWRLARDVGGPVTAFSEFGQRISTRL